MEYFSVWLVVFCCCCCLFFAVVVVCFLLLLLFVFCKAAPHGSVLGIHVFFCSVFEACCSSVVFEILSLFSFFPDQLVYFHCLQVCHVLSAGLSCTVCMVCHVLSAWFVMYCLHGLSCTVCRFVMYCLQVCHVLSAWFVTYCLHGLSCTVCMACHVLSAWFVIYCLQVCHVLSAGLSCTV